MSETTIRIVAMLVGAFVGWNARRVYVLWYVMRGMRRVEREVEELRRKGVGSNPPSPGPRPPPNPPTVGRIH